MENEQKLANDWWYYANFSRVIKFIESLYPKNPTIKDRIVFWKSEGCPTIPTKFDRIEAYKNRTDEEFERYKEIFKPKK